MDMDMQHGHGHTAQLWSCSVDLVMDMHGCRNADKSGIVSFPLVYDAESGIGIPALLSVQYC
jgi:hypothetical protein